MNTIINDDAIGEMDRIYFLDPSKVVRLQSDEEVITQELIPTNDPNIYTMRITAPVPRFAIKTAKGELNAE